jgi:DeoD family purine-nucleoside phosphorylase
MIHIHPTAPLAARALLPGDPGRALALAQVLLDEPRMFNHNRGLWGYTGTAADGEPMTIQSTGMGGPSAAIVLEELIALGLRRAVRVGTCGALDGRLALGDLLIAETAIADDGTSRALGAGEIVAASESLTGALRAAAPQALGGRVASTDLFYAPDAPARTAAWLAAGAVAVEMESATLFALGARHGIEVACALAVSDVLAGGRTRIGAEELVAAGERVGRLGAAALSA